MRIRAGRQGGTRRADSKDKRSLAHWVLEAAKSDAGMTILELLVVVSILGLLATLGSIQVLGYLGRAKADAARLQLGALMVAVDVFEMDVGRPPHTDEGMDALLSKPATAEGWRGPYLRGRSLLRDPWGRDYVYRSDPETGGYEIVSLGADGRVDGEGDAADISSRSLP